MQSILTSILRFQQVITVILLCQLFIFLVGCGHSVEDVSKTPTPPVEPIEAPPSKVSAPLNDELKDAQLKSLGLQAKLILDDTTEYDMDINNGEATWQSADLPVQSPYDVTVRFEIEVGSNPSTYLVVAQANANHDFAVETTKTFQASDLSIAFDADDDSMSNLAEFLVGGHPANAAPTLLSEAQITVLENSTNVLTVQAISPRTDPVVYSIVLNDNDLFAIIPETGVLSFKTAIVYGTNNQYSVTVRANDGSFTAEQTIAVTVTDVFDLKVDTGLKQLQFHWSAAPGASYYKILQNLDGGGVFTELPDSGSIASLNYNQPIAVHLFDQVNTSFKLQAYDSSDSIIRESAAIGVAAKLNGAIGYLKSTLPTAGDWFGFAVALSADGNTLVVGAYGENNFAGVVHVFSHATGAWLPQGSVKAPNSEEWDRFGVAVTLSADGNTLVVGASNEDSDAKGVYDASAVPVDNNSAPDAGAVYVYGRASNADAFSHQAYIKAPNSEEGDFFGIAVALSADGNTLVVGATSEDSDAKGVYDALAVPDNNSAPDSGAVYVFGRATNAEAFDSQAYIKAPNRGNADWFGVAVTLSADGNILVVGARSESSAAQGVSITPAEPDDNRKLSAGAVYVYGRASNIDAYTPQAYVKAPNSGASDLFGYAVALSADGNTLVVGAYHEESSDPVDPDDNGASSAGAVYLY